MVERDCSQLHSALRLAMANLAFATAEEEHPGSDFVQGDYCYIVVPTELGSLHA